MWEVMYQPLCSMLLCPQTNFGRKTKKVLGRGEAHWGASLEAAYPGNPSITQTFPEFNLFPD